MRIIKALIPFSLVLAAGCAAAGAPATGSPGMPQDLVLRGRSTGAATPAVSSTATPLPVPQVIRIIDDFEGDGTAWTVCVDPECADSSATGVALSPEHAAHGAQALVLNFEKNEKPKAVFYIAKPMDWSGGRTVRFDIYHEGTIDGVGFALTTGAEAVWHESDTVPVEQGRKVTISFDLTAGKYKTAATSWEFRSFIADRNNVVRLSIILYPKKSGSAVIDYVCLTDPA